MPENARRPLAQDVLISALVAIPLGSLGFALLFSDVSYGPAQMLGWLVIHFFVPGVLVGLLVPKRWFLSVLVAWPVFALGAGAIVSEWAVGNYPVVRVAITEGSLTVTPTAFPRRFRLIVRNQGSDVHELGLTPIEEHADLGTVAANLPLGSSTPPLRAGETHEAVLDMPLGSHAFHCTRAGHAVRGEVAKVRFQ